MIGRVDDVDLPAIYAEAQVFAYPSEYEGFGLQVCEALAVGCLVFVRMPVAYRKFLLMVEKCFLF